MLRPHWGRSVIALVFTYNAADVNTDCKPIHSVLVNDDYSVLVNDDYSVLLCVMIYLYFVPNQELLPSTESSRVRVVMPHCISYQTRSLCRQQKAVG